MSSTEVGLLELSNKKKNMTHSPNRSHRSCTSYESFHDFEPLG